MRRVNSVIQQDRMRKKDSLTLENDLFNRRKKLNSKGRKGVATDLNVNLPVGGMRKSNCKRYSLRGYIGSDVNTGTLKQHAEVPRTTLCLKRKRLSLNKKPKSMNHNQMKHEESFASSDEEMPIKRKKFYTVQNGEICAEMYKTDFVYHDDGSDLSSDDDDMIPIKDRWKEDWNQGVQVPVNKNLPEFVVRNVPCTSTAIVNCRKPIQMPDRLISVHSRKYVRDRHFRTGMPRLSQYHCDRTDIEYLRLLNERRSLSQLYTISVKQFATLMEQFEVSCYEAIHHDLLAPVARRRDADHDEETCCEICGQADCEDDDPIVFCEICMVPVHQSCYGVEVLPKGDWICDVCSEFDPNSIPTCVFCPYTGGAMKVAEDGSTWAHISCALWIPEVRFGNHVRREPITKIDDVPSGRWDLRCSVCDTSVGACIQCSNDACASAFHVTCALREKYVMRIEHAGTENVRMLSFCGEHSRMDLCTNKAGKGFSHDRSREKRIVEKMEENFFLYVSPEKISEQLNIREDVVDEVYEYWKLKRADNGNRMLLMDRSILENKVVSELSLKLRKNLQVGFELRHDLEKVRNLCHMVKLRERQKIQMFNVLKDTYNIVFNCIVNSHVPLSGRVLNDYREKLDNPYFNHIFKGDATLDDFESLDSVNTRSSSSLSSCPKQNFSDDFSSDCPSYEMTRPSLYRKKVNDTENKSTIKANARNGRGSRRRLKIINLKF